MEIKSTYLTEAAVMRTRISQLQATIAENVDLARAAGATWAEVGRALGISPQGAHKQFSPKITGRIDSMTVPGKGQEKAGH